MIFECRRKYRLAFRSLHRLRIYSSHLEEMNAKYQIVYSTSPIWINLTCNWYTNIISYPFIWLHTITQNYAEIAHVTAFNSIQFSSTHFIWLSYYTLKGMPFALVIVIQFMQDESNIIMIYISSVFFHIWRFRIVNID